MIDLLPAGVSEESLTALCRRWKVQRLWVFGSAARGELRPDSDIDLMVRFQTDESWSLLDFARMKLELEEILGRSVDLVEEGSIRNPFRLRSIMRDLAPVYAA
jgi:uncharacterized protein